jgi:hypothetical protein
MSKITVEVTFTEKEFRKMIKDAEFKITDEAKFLKIINSKKFAKTLAADLKLVWEETNEESHDLDMVIAGLDLDECTEEVEYN